MLQARRLALTLPLALATFAAGCGYHVVRKSDVVAQKFAADSAAMLSLQGQIADLRARWHADSLHWSADIAAAKVVPPPAPAQPALADSLRAREAEVASLKDQLTQANAELDRIKRRLATPRT